MARTIENSRSAQSHALNHRSSRSHCLITLSLRQIDAKGAPEADMAPDFSTVEVVRGIFVVACFFVCDDDTCRTHVNFQI